MFRKECGFDSLHGHQPSLLRSYGWRASPGDSGEAAKAARRSPEGEDGLGPMKYVYLFQSVEFGSGRDIAGRDAIGKVYDDEVPPGR